MTTIEEKIQKYIELGGTIIVRNPLDGGYYSRYNEIVIYTSWEEVAVTKALDDGLKQINTKPWLKFIEDLNSKK